MTHTSPRERQVYTLGLNAAFHDPAACLVCDGVVVAAAEEERFTHVKHGKRPVPFSTWELPFHAIDACLAQAGIRLADVQHVAYSFDPSLRLGRRRPDATIELPLEPSAAPASNGWEAPWDPLFLSSIVNAPRQLAGGVPHHLQARWRGVHAGGPFQWHFVPHHLAHAASAFLPSPFDRAAIMTLDGRGEIATTSYAAGEGNAMTALGEVRMPHSLGIFYEEVTGHLGFLHSSDEYKVMALASSGRPTYADALRRAIRVGEDGSYTVCPPPLAELFGPARDRGGPLEQRHFDIAKSLQVVLEETVLALASWLYERTALPDLCLAGGVALNCVMNARLRDEGPFRRIWVQPAAGDAGTALGAALLVDADVRRDTVRKYRMASALLGPSFGDGEIAAFLDWCKLPYRRLADVPAETADLLARDKVVGWFQGAMEFGPRALGARSILASPIHASMQARLNEIKDREDFRPVAPAVIEEKADDWFVSAQRSPFMLFVFDVRPEKAGRIPAVRHIDGTARIQTVARQDHPLYYDLLAAFERRTGVPVLVNTSFNTRGEPIVCTPRDAVESFLTSPLDVLVIGSFLVEKRQVTSGDGHD
jgi:carbamoyltransferase